MSQLQGQAERRCNNEEAFSWITPTPIFDSESTTGKGQWSGGTRLYKDIDRYLTPKHSGWKKRTTGKRKAIFLKCRISWIIFYSAHIRLVSLEEEQKVVSANNPEDKRCLRVDYVTVFQNVGGGEAAGASPGCNLCLAASPWRLWFNLCYEVCVENDALCLFMSRDLYLTDMTRKHLCSLWSENR